MAFSPRSTTLLLFLGCLCIRSGRASEGFPKLVSKSTSRLPMSLSSVINDLEAEGAAQVARACLVTSRGVTHKRREEILRSIFGLDEFDLTAFGTKAEHADGGLAIAYLNSEDSASDVASTVMACGGTVVFVPSSVDLSRGEGLFDTLAAAMERLLASGTKSALIVLAADVESARHQLQAAASFVLPNLIQPKGRRSAQVLEDVFETVDYVSGYNEVAEKLKATKGCEPSEAADAVDATVDLFAPSAMPSLSNKDLAAARTLGPAARSALESATNKVQEVLKASPLIRNFGDLCDATVNRAMQDVNFSALSSARAKQLKLQLQDELYSELGGICDDQLDLLRLASFDAFKKSLSGLRVSPNLAKDMDEVVRKSITEFHKDAKTIIAKGAKTWSTTPAKTSFALKLHEFCSDRLLVARASGQYKPFPRKGVTVGLHWLLPKPFGNDFRQEPWMVHAIDNMVYVPADKVTNITPDEVKDGDWRDKVIPSPSSREMVYSQ
eukprot:CAMPEP_0194211026 /NCGR_PEP_ID=MMETSP0156-20130528/9242_1 /TAXON_ID=33649 /ORGANISM="Thalassionema nitzschioides, Strain L26-B" /LENGTH=496 /DNA_ID=CAMNT_0038938451 /DNA_START=30 /DNA_END=1520 /DNA_ORIENTATION=-